MYTVFSGGNLCLHNEHDKFELHFIKKIIESLFLRPHRL